VRSRSFSIREPPAPQPALTPGKTRYFHVFPWRDYYIWGATAGMLVQSRRPAGGCVGRGRSLPSSDAAVRVIRDPAVYGAHVQ